MRGNAMTVKRDIQNNIFILKCIYQAGKEVLGISFFSIIVECIWTYVAANMGVWVYDSINTVSVTSLISFVVILLSVLVSLESLNRWFFTLTIPIAQSRITEYMSDTLIKKVFEIYQGDVEDENFFNLYSRAISEINTRPAEVLNMCRNIVSGLIQLIVLLIISTKLNWLFTALFLVASIVSATITAIINNLGYRQYEASTKTNRQLSYINRVIYQPEYGRLLRTNWGFRGLLAGKNSEYSEDLRGFIKEFGKKIGCLRILNTAIGYGCFEILPWAIAIFGLYEGTLTFGSVTMIMSITDHLPYVFTLIFGSIANFRKQSLYIENLRAVVEYKSSKKINNKEIDLPKGVLETTDKLSFTYSLNQELTLKDVNVTLNKGELTAFVGPNGAGKSTLACLLAGLYTASDGYVYLDRQDTNSIAGDVLSEKVIMIGQDSVLLSVSIIENILQRSPKNLEDYELAENALKKVGMYEKVKSLKKGIDTIVSKEFDNDGIVFSGGERQKISLARVYASRAELIILDEPTSALDAFSENEITDIIYQLAKSKTMLIISHRLSMVTRADKIMYIDKGKIVEEGTHLSLLEKRGKYYELFKTQADKYEICEEVGD